MVVHDLSSLACHVGGGGRGVVVRELRKGVTATLRGKAESEAIVFDNGIPGLDGGAEDPSFTVSGLKSLTLYQFRVRAANGNGYGSWTEPTPRVRTTAVRHMAVACLLASLSSDRWCCLMLVVSGSTTSGLYI